MAKSQNDLMLDAALNYIKDNATVETVCSAQPTTYAEATSTYKLADVTVASGDFTLSDGDTNGRKVRVAAKSAVPIDTTGEGNHIALCSGTVLLYVTTCTAQQLTQGGTVDVPYWDIELADAA
jgi:hypothetical protein